MSGSFCASLSKHSEGSLTLSAEQQQSSRRSIKNMEALCMIGWSHAVSIILCCASLLQFIFIPGESYVCFVLCCNFGSWWYVIRYWYDFIILSRNATMKTLKNPIFIRCYWILEFDCSKCFFLFFFCVLFQVWIFYEACLTDCMCVCVCVCVCVCACACACR